MNLFCRNLSLLASGLVMATCQNPLKDVELKFIDPLPVVVILRLIPPGGVLPKSPTIRLVGPDAGLVVTPLNMTTFTLSDDGRLYLSLLPSAMPAASRPLHFTVVVTAPGTYDVVYPVVLTSRSTRVVSEEWMPVLPASPVVQMTGSSDGAGLTQAVLMAQTLPLNTGSGPTQLTIPLGDRVNDGTGAAVAGMLTLRLRQLDSHLASQFAGNGILFQPLSASGQPTPTQQLAAIAGGVRMLVYAADYKTIKSFSKAAQLRFQLNPQLINPRKNRPVQPGDPVALLSYDAAAGRWQQEPAGSVVRTAQNGLDYVADITHAADYWVAAFISPACDAGPIFTISSPVPPGNLLYHCQVIDAGTGQPLPNMGGNTDFYSTVTNGQTVQLYFLPVGSTIKLRVYDSESKTVVTSAAAAGCSTAPVALNLASFSKPKNAPIPVTVALQFPCKSLNEARLPTKAIYAQFRETGASTWHDLPVLRYEPGKTEFSITTYDVTVGKTYDLQAGASPGNYTVSESAQLIDTSQWIIKIKTTAYCN